MTNTEKTNEAPKGPSDSKAMLCGCGSIATKLVQMHTHEHEPQPICEDCAAHHEEQAAEVNEHEMKHFGGSHGLVSWTYLPLTHNA